MKRTILISLSLLVLIAGGVAFALTRGGDLVTPQGEGTIALDDGTFEAFPLPDYAAKHITDDYKSYFIEVEPGIKVHMLELGSGYPVFLMHGNPTSGFLYRKVAAELPTDRLRLIMPTQVGRGFSSKVPASEHTLENHMRWINAALTKLQLTELVYMGQDWGGAVGLGALSLSPDLLQGAVLANTGFNAPTEAGSLSTAHDIAKTRILGELLFERVVSIFDRLPATQGDPASMPADVTELYGRPVIESGNAKAPLAMMRMVPYSPDEPSSVQMRDIERYVAGLDMPVELVWGMNDPILGRALPRMQQNFPDAPVTETEAGHFLQEEVPAEIAAALLRIIDQVQLQTAE